MLLHPRLAIKAIFSRLFSLLKLPLKKLPFIANMLRKRAEARFVFCGANVVNGEKVVDRHIRICRILRDELDRMDLDALGSACEIGSGDCLASADLLLGYGFKRVIIVEKPIPPIDEAHVEILKSVAASGLPNKLQVVSSENQGELDLRVILPLEAYFEHVMLPEPTDLLFSFDVLEHVENLDQFVGSCFRALREGGRMIHKFDLSGHGPLEDPIPPLDFQTYPNWLYDLMFPKFARAVRNPLRVFVDRFTAAGFEGVHVRVLHRANRAYVERLRPKLRAELKMLSYDDLSPLDIVLTATKPSSTK
jgi:SAM-dependent methyltransferase